MELERVETGRGKIWIDKKSECQIGQMLYLQNGGLYGAPTVIVNYGRHQNTGEGFLVVAQSADNQFPINKLPFVEDEVNFYLGLVKDLIVKATSFSGPNMMEKCEGLLRFISKSKENQFSESDLGQGIEMARQGWFSKTSENTTDKEWEFNETEIIKALKKNKPTIIEIEIEEETKIPLTYQKDGKIYLKLK